jgi:hypothetical protein
MAWIHYTAPLPPGSRPTAPQMAELMAAYGERAAFQLNNFFSTTGFGLSSIQASLATTMLEGLYVFWTGDINPPGAIPLHQPLDEAIGKVISNALVTDYSLPTDWWTGSSALFSAAASDIGANWLNAKVLMTVGMLNTDYFNISRHAMQLLAAYSFDGVAVQTPSWTYP